MAGAAAPSADPDYPAAAWYGNIQYLLNISAAGAASCLLLFILVKLQSDHHRFPGPSALAAKLLAVYHATPAQIALRCGADAAQFLLIERASFFVLLALVAALPLNLYAGSVLLADPFARTTISHLRPGSPLIWLHLLLVVLVVAVAHLGITRMVDDLRITRFRDGNGNPSDPNSSSISIFTIMVQGIPKALTAAKAPLEEYLQHRYPEKVYRVVMPFDICTLEYLVSNVFLLLDSLCFYSLTRDERGIYRLQINLNLEPKTFPSRVSRAWAVPLPALGGTTTQ
ncbi:unnamed protein product, partial [Musa acuminata subsp. malaccensis]